MPVMDGVEALPTIRRLCPAARIIVLSGFGADQMSARAVAVGADGYVQKGAPLSKILDYVRELDRRRLWQGQGAAGPGADHQPGGVGRRR